MEYYEIEQQLVGHEGFKGKPYLCTAGKTSIGFGRNLTDKGITKQEAKFLLRNDIFECYIDLDTLIFPEQFKTWPDELQHAMIDMRFQLGMTGFRSFKKMIAALRIDDRIAAAAEAIDSNWYKQVPGRAKTIVGMIRG
jgi:lysozyme